jgi:hypothetical protein
VINTIKWTIFYRTKKDKERSILIFDLIWKKLDCDTWGDDWTDEQQDLFYEQIDLLLPVKDDDVEDIYQLIREVFGEVIIKDESIK